MGTDPRAAKGPAGRWAAAVRKAVAGDANWPAAVATCAPADEPAPAPCGPVVIRGNAYQLPAVAALFAATWAAAAAACLDLSAVAIALAAAAAAAAANGDMAILKVSVGIAVA